MWQIDGLISGSEEGGRLTQVGHRKVTTGQPPAIAAGQATRESYIR